MVADAALACRAPGVICHTDPVGAGPAVTAGRAISARHTDAAFASFAGATRGISLACSRDALTTIASGAVTDSDAAPSPSIAGLTGTAGGAAAPVMTTASNRTGEERDRSRTEQCSRHRRQQDTACRPREQASRQNIEVIPVHRRPPFVLPRRLMRSPCDADQAQRLRRLPGVGSIVLAHALRAGTLTAVEIVAASAAFELAAIPPAAAGAGAAPTRALAASRRDGYVFAVRFAEETRLTRREAGRGTTRTGFGAITARLTATVSRTALSVD